MTLQYFLQLNSQKNSKYTWTRSMEGKMSYLFMLTPALYANV